MFSGEEESARSLCSQHTSSYDAQIRVGSPRDRKRAIRDLTKYYSEPSDSSLLSQMIPWEILSFQRSFPSTPQDTHGWFNLDRKNLVDRKTLTMSQSAEYICFIRNNNSSNSC